MSKATEIGDELLAFAEGLVPASDNWTTEIHLSRGNLPASRNKFLACNSCALVEAWRHGRKARVVEILDWWAWFSVQPFTDGEDLTPEEAYRTLQAYAALVAAAIALITGHHGYQAIRKHARAHAAWLIIGAAPGPGKRIVDHQLEKLTEPVILVGSGSNACDLPYVTQAGQRGWVRNREKNQPKTFLFCDRVGLSVIVGQVLGRSISRKLAAWQVDIFEAIRDLSPNLPVWGFDGDELESARAFLADPTNPAKAQRIVKMLEGFAPSLPFTFLRYESGAAVSLMRQSSGSSTDPCMIDVWLPGGKTLKASADDGLRESSSPQRGWFEGAFLACQKAIGSTKVVRVPAPDGAIAWRLDADLGFLRFLTGHEPSGPSLPPPVDPPAEDPCGQRPEKPSWWKRWGRAAKRYRAEIEDWERCKRGEIQDEHRRRSVP